MMERVLIVGDTHCNPDYWSKEVLPAAREAQVGAIVQLGDFGYWPLTRDGVDYLAFLSAELDKADLDVYWIDGNHDDHLALSKLVPRPDGFVEITERILWAPRGQRWEWSGVRFLGLGGAFSVDRGGRKLNSGRWGWFQEEVLTSQQADQAIQGGPCDVLLTHDAPEQMVPMLEDRNFHFGWLPAESRQTSQLVSKVALATKPRLLFHGHWHYFYHSEIDVGGATGVATCQVVSLACDDMPQSWCVLELPSLAMSIPLPSPDIKANPGTGSRRVNPDGA